MAKDEKKSPAKKRTASSGREYYESQYNGETYDSKTADQIKVRVRKGEREKINAYVAAKHAENPENPKYRTLNAMMLSLLREETGLDLK